MVAFLKKFFTNEAFFERSVRSVLVLSGGVLIADRHLHAPPDWAKRWGLEDQQIVSCRAGEGGPKPTILDSVRIRLDPEFVLEAHLDTDDANACFLSNGDLLEVLL